MGENPIPQVEAPKRLRAARKPSSPVAGASDSASDFRLLAETIPAITWTADANGRVHYLNERFYLYTGLPSGLAREDWPQDVVHPADRQAVAEAWKDAVLHGHEHRCESRLRRHDGMYRWFEAHAVPHRDAGGRVVQWFGATTDIEDRKRAEAIAAFMSRASAELAELSDYRATLVRIAESAIPAFADWSGIFLADAQGNLQRLRLANSDPDRVRFLHGMRERYPYRPSDPIGPGRVMATGHSCWAAHISDEVLVEFAHDAEHLEMLRQVNFRSYVAVPIRLKGRIGGAMSFVMAESGRAYDESHLRVAEDLAHRVGMAIENQDLVEALRESDRHKGELLTQLQAADRRKDQFIAMLAHELRSPLAPIRNSVQVLRAKSGPDQPELQWAREVIERQVHHMSRLVDDLLDVARVGEGKMELRIDRVLLSSAVNSAVEACRPEIDRRRHQLTVSMPAEPIAVMADLTRLAQVFANLIHNAAKYTDGGGRIQLVVERGETDAVVRVCDNGIGIPPAMIDRIFEPFTQVERSLDRAQGGLGIGLTLARRLVEMHGGRLTAASAGEGRGSEFTARLPLPASRLT
jgi:PAS domain S-box-containing protein